MFHFTYYLAIAIQKMKFELDMDDYTIILNALHYYKKVEKRGNFKQYNEERVNKLRDKMSYQLIPSAESWR
tara:strand:+ start:542 stop:754 length:213 start_codon:yes stop_codon:yes gene_type:complete